MSLLVVEMTIVQELEDDIEKCLTRLCDRLQVSRKGVSSHTLLIITGIDHSAGCLRDLAIYCVGQIARAIQVNLEIRADLLGVENDSGYALEQLTSDVYSIIGEHNEILTERQKREDRDAWLFEALSHLLVHLSQEKADLLPVGSLIALSVTHGSVKEQGLDMVAIYAGGAFVGMGVGESKAWEKNPSGGLTEAASKFVEIDDGFYEAELRKVVGQMRFAMPRETQDQMTNAFWRNERSYLPFIGYDSKYDGKGWTSSQKALESLGVPPTRRLLLPLPIADFRGFFDELSDAMRDYLEGLEG